MSDENIGTYDEWQRVCGAKQGKNNRKDGMSNDIGVERRTFEKLKGRGRFRREGMIPNISLMN